MSDPSSSYSVSTNAKILINEWKALRELVLGATSTPEASEPALLTDRQINDALFGPFHPFFQQKLSSYATLAKARLLFAIAQDEALKNQSPESIRGLEKITLSEVDKIQGELDELSKQHYETWQAHLKNWNQKLLLSLTANDLSLSEIEIQEFQNQEPLSELFDRFTDLHLDMPTWEPMGFQQYLQLKAHLAIHSCLSRQHQPHETTEIQKRLKKLKKDFDHISAEEKKLIESQKRDTQKIIEPLAKVVSNL